MTTLAEKMEEEKRFASNATSGIATAISPIEMVRRLYSNASEKLGGATGIVKAGVGDQAGTLVNKATGIDSASKLYNQATAPEFVPQGPPMPETANPGEVETRQAGAPTATAKPAASGGGGYAAPQMLERDLLGPTQKAALAGYRNAEKDYASKWADPYLAMQQQEEALQRRAIEEQKAVANVQAQAETERSRELAERQSQFDASVKELSSMQIDPGRAMKNSNPLQFAFGAIAAMLGGAQSARTGGPNQGIEMLDKWIDRDIDAQKMAYQIKKEGVNQQQTAFGQAMTRFGDMRQAEAIARASLKERFATEAMAMAAKTKRTDLMDKAAQMQVQLRKSAAEDAQKFIAYGQVGGGGGSPASKLLDLESDKLITIDGQEILASNATSASKIREAMAMANNMDALDKEALAIRQGGNAWRLPKWVSSDAARLEQIQGKRVLLEKELSKLGVIAGPDMGLVEASGGDATGQGGSNSVKLREGSKIRQDAIRRGIATENAQVIHSGMKVDKAGNLKPGMVYTGQRYTPKLTQDLQDVANQYPVSGPPQKKKAK